MEDFIASWKMDLKPPPIHKKRRMRKKMLKQRIGILEWDLVMRLARSINK